MIKVTVKTLPLIVCHSKFAVWSAVRNVIHILRHNPFPHILSSKHIGPPLFISAMDALIRKIQLCC